MRVYLSTTSLRLERAKEAMDQLRGAGFEIIYDWAEEMVGEPEMAASELGQRAVYDIDGASSCDHLVVLMLREMETSMTGTAVEIGAALGAGKPVHIITEEIGFGHFFAHHPFVMIWSGLDQWINTFRPVA